MYNALMLDSLTVDDMVEAVSIFFSSVCIPNWGWKIYIIL